MEPQDTPPWICTDHDSLCVLDAYPRDGCKSGSALLVAKGINHCFACVVIDGILCIYRSPCKALGKLFVCCLFVFCLYLFIRGQEVILFLLFFLFFFVRNCLLIFHFISLCISYFLPVLFSLLQYCQYIIQYVVFHSFPFRMRCSTRLYIPYRVIYFEGQKNGL